jgi:hypothetical protein
MTIHAYGDWIPVVPTQDVGTIVLVDSRQADVWQAAVDTIATASIDGSQGRETCRDLHKIVERELDQIRHQDHGDQLIADEATDDLFGRTRYDAELLCRAGAIDQPSPLNGLLRHVPHIAVTDVFPAVSVIAAVLLVATTIHATGTDSPENWVLVVALATICLTTGAGSVLLSRMRRSELLDLDIGPQLQCTDGSRRRTIEAGTNTDLANLMRELHDTVPELTDPLWDLYEQTTDIAEEAALRQAAVSQKELQSYNDGIGIRVARIERELAYRKNRVIERQKIQRELESGPPGADDDAAAGLAARLAELDRAWDVILPDSRPSIPDNDEEKQ